MKPILCACLFVAAALPARAADESGDRKALQGVWTPSTAELGG